MSGVVIRTNDGVAHGVPRRGGRDSAFLLETACGLEFGQWRYAGKHYGRRPYGAGDVPTLGLGGVDCMTCLVAIGRTEDA